MTLSHKLLALLDKGEPVWNQHWLLLTCGCGGLAVIGAVLLVVQVLKP